MVGRLMLTLGACVCERKLHPMYTAICRCTVLFSCWASKIGDGEFPVGLAVRMFDPEEDDAQNA
eukprot:6212782-Pleurochrysis_carterae.AAC.3